MPRPHSSAKTCLLIVDMINEFEFANADRILPAIETTAQCIADLKRRVKQSRHPVVYVNDNFGKWQSDFRKLVGRCLKEQCRGKQAAQILLPEDDDYFVLKPKHSGFYATPLDLLLKFLKVSRVIITGIAGDNCVLFTAADAYMREFDVVVPADCIVSLTPERNKAALEQMKLTLKADIRPSKKILHVLAA